MFREQDRLTLQGVLEQMQRLSAEMERMQRLLDVALELAEHRKAGELVSEGIENLMRFAGAPARR